VTYRRVLNWTLGFIALICTQLLTTINYSAIAVSTLYISLLHTLMSPHSIIVSTIRFLATDFNTGSIKVSL
jgi:hypothetical protein